MYFVLWYSYMRFNEIRKLKEYKKADYITVWYKLKKIIFWKFVWRKLNQKEQNFVIMSCDWWDKLTGAGTESWRWHETWNWKLLPGKLYSALFLNVLSFQNNKLPRKKRSMGFYCMTWIFYVLFWQQFCWFWPMVVVLQLRIFSLKSKHSVLSFHELEKQLVYLDFSRPWNEWVHFYSLCYTLLFLLVYS